MPTSPTARRGRSPGASHRGIDLKKQGERRRESSLGASRRTRDAQRQAQLQQKRSEGNSSDPVLPECSGVAPLYPTTEREPSPEPMIMEVDQVDVPLYSCAPESRAGTPDIPRSRSVAPVQPDAAEWRVTTAMRTAFNGAHGLASDAVGGTLGAAVGTVTGASFGGVAQCCRGNRAAAAAFNATHNTTSTAVATVIAGATGAATGTVLGAGTGVVEGPVDAFRGKGAGQVTKDISRVVTRLPVSMAVGSSAGALLGIGEGVANACCDDGAARFARQATQCAARTGAGAMIGALTGALRGAANPSPMVQDATTAVIEGAARGAAGAAAGTVDGVTAVPAAVMSVMSARQRAQKLRAEREQAESRHEQRAHISAMCDRLDAHIQTLVEIVDRAKENARACLRHKNDKSAKARAMLFIKKQHVFTDYVIVADKQKTNLEMLQVQLDSASMSVDYISTIKTGSVILGELNAKLKDAPQVMANCQDEMARARSIQQVLSEPITDDVPDGEIAEELAKLESEVAREAQPKPARLPTKNLPTQPTAVAARPMAAPVQQALAA